MGRHLTEPEETSYLSSYHLPLGHAFACVPSGPFTSGPFEETDYSKKTLSIPQDYRRIILEKVVRDYFPTLLIQQKWHTTSEHESRRVKRGSNKVKWKWKLGKVSKCKIRDDNKIRRIAVQYKVPKLNESMHEYKGRPYTTVERAVQRLVVIVPDFEE